MTAADKIFKAKVNLIMNHPWFATWAIKMKYIEDPSVQTACTNGKYIKYNPQFVDQFDLDQIVFLLAHEVMHPAMFHHTRRQGRKPGKWNKAADYAINEILTKAGFKMIPGGLIDPQFYGMSAEKIYNLLPDMPDDDQNDPGGCGGVVDADAQDNSQLQEIEAGIKQQLAQAIQTSKRCGNIPAGIERLVEELLEPIVDWREALSRFLTDSEMSDYSFKKPNTRFLGTGFYLPTLESQTQLGEICLMIDTSGSIGHEIMNRMASEVQEIVNTFNKGFTVMYIDAAFQLEEEIEPDGRVELHPKGGGGTCFKPGFRHLEEQEREPECVVYLTDGYCNSFPKEPDYPVLWVLVEENESFNPPFGETIVMGD